MPRPARAARLAVAALVFAALPPSPAAAVPLPVADHFESPHVHPLELSGDGTTLFAVHTPDHKLSIFDLTGPAPVRTGQVPVGIEPVTVRVAPTGDVWVVNHVSDSISLVDPASGNVVRTLLVGDEPTDVRFAAGKAFVCVSQEDLVRVFELADLDVPPVDVPLLASDPRSLELSPDSTEVWVTALDSQNETTAIHFTVVQALGGLPAPNPPMASGLPDAPDVGLIVRHDGTAWRDEAGRSWNAAVGYSLLDHDVIRISTATATVVGQWKGVGTTLFNAAVHPVTGLLYVTNQEAMNEIRFEPNLRGRFLTNRVTVIDPGAGTVTPVPLNAHIDYANPTGTATERALSLAIPTDVAVAGTGEVYVAATGSAKVGVLDAGGNVTRRIDVGQGPTGLALDEARSALYVLNRFAGTLSVVDLTDDSSVEIPLGFDGSAPEVVAGRRILYDGELSSAHGDLACASCHVFGGMDNVAWDLGDPEGTFVPPPAPGLRGFHPMKGPMTTQSLKGLGGTEPLHWRGDRDDFLAFNGAFVSLMGRLTELTPGDMELFEDFVLTMKYPPNPFRELDNGHLPSLNGGDPANGEQQFLTGNLVGGAQCVDCHALPTGENGLIIPAAALAEDQDMVVPQLRNMYEKSRFDADAATNVRGFGFTHDGAVDDLFTFLQFPAFSFSSDQERLDVAAALFAWDNGTPPALGAQWTMDGTNEAAGSARVSTLVALADAGTIGLVAKGRDGAGEARGWTRIPSAGFDPDRESEPLAPLAALLALAGPGTEITFTAVPKGNEGRLGIDQDGDGYLDRDELDAGSDPGDPGSIPGDPTGAPLAVAGGTRPAVWLAGANPAAVESRLGFRVPGAGAARLDVYDLGGRRIRTLASGAPLAAGRHERIWDLRDAGGRRVASGVYFVRLETERGVARQRVVVLR